MKKEDKLELLVIINKLKRENFCKESPIFTDGSSCITRRRKTALLTLSIKAIVVIWYEIKNLFTSQGFYYSIKIYAADGG